MRRRVLRSTCWCSLAALSCACSSASSTDPIRIETARQGAAASEFVAAYVVMEGPSAVAALPRGTDVRSAAGVAATKQRVAALGRGQRALQPALEAEGALVTARYARLLNGFQVLASPAVLQRIASLPGVLRVERVPVYSRSLLDAVPTIGAPKLWQASTPLRGEGIRVAIVDTGIDYLHADFGGSGDPGQYALNDSTKIEPGTFPTATVVDGWDFVGDAYGPDPFGAGGGSSIPVPDPDPLDCAANGHGTHVAGITAGRGVKSDGATYAGPYQQSLSPAAFKVGPGVAPAAALYAYKVFGCAGSTTNVGPALERAVDPNQDGDLSDRVDVINASLGTSYALGFHADAEIVTNLAAAGVLYVVAAGNDGDATYSLGSPANYPEVLSVAASTDAQFVTLHIDSPSSLAGGYAAAESTFARPLSSGPVSAALVHTVPADGCTPLANAAAIAGNIALVDRGTCTFIEKLTSVEDAGAAAIVVVDNKDGEAPFVMNGGNQGDVKVPAVMISKVDGAKISAALSGGVSATLSSAMLTGPGSETLASFSSRGPSADFGALKPEVAAPGFAIDSAGVGTGTEGRRMDGTSMATPMVAGAAALVRQAHPEWTPEVVKAAMMNSAVPLFDEDANPYTVSLAGAGRVDVAASAGLDVTAASDAPDGSVGVSFGTIVTADPYGDVRRIVVTNRGTTAVTYDLDAASTYPLSGVTLSVDPSSLTVAAGKTATVSLTISVDPYSLPLPAPDPVTPAQSHQQARHYVTDAGGRLRFNDRGPGAKRSIALPFEVVVRAAGHRTAGASLCLGGDSSGTFTVPIHGESAFPNPLVSAFQLGVLSEKLPESDTDPVRAQLDLLATGATSDVPTQGFQNGTVYFGLAVAGEWTTPARGSVSLVGVDVDTNEDDVADFQIFIEPIDKDQPHGDVLSAVTYPAGEQTTTLSHRFVNTLSAGMLYSAPFNNSVLVVSAFAKDLGLTADHSKIKYRGFSQSWEFSTSGDMTEYAMIDVAHPALDTTQRGLQGRPMFVGLFDVSVSVDPTLTGPLPDLLLLHHTNARNERFEVVKLVGQNLSLSTTALAPAAQLTPAQPAGLTLTINNPSGQPREGVKLSGSVEGGAFVLDFAHPAQGSCTVAPRLACDLGTLAAGAAITIAVAGHALGEGVATFAASATAAGCETDGSDDAVTTTIGVIAPPAAGAPSALTPAGGCGCHAARGVPRGAVALASLGLALLLARRRRRSASEAGP